MRYRVSIKVQNYWDDLEKETSKKVDLEQVVEAKTYREAVEKLLNQLDSIG